MIIHSYYAHIVNKMAQDQGTLKLTNTQFENMDTQMPESAGIRDICPSFTRGMY